MASVALITRNPMIYYTLGNEEIISGRFGKQAIHPVAVGARVGFFVAVGGIGIHLFSDRFGHGFRDV